MNKNGKDEIKIKGKFLINIESRTEEKKLKFTKWLNAQSNPQNSFLSLIEHCIDRFGYEDVMDHEVARKLYTELLYFNNKEVLKPKDVTVVNDFLEEDQDKKEKSEERTRKVDVKREKQENRISINPDSF